ncbi:MAG: acylneuraminate cytidylyltransferase [Bdellovibrio sp. CG10_big_fil_rev_8_21_14_0_10_47_8]|nr:MAG: acylneuraminate cytidylyltransferase [Bdellovibrio sp. CG10_big_fil_rev_8_21_14_0_10_47_8]
MKSGKTFTVINQARMTSTRLPGKVLKPVLGKPLLEYQIERIRRSRHLHDLVIATTVNAEDQAIVALCERLNVHVFRGSEMDVLGRYYQAHLKYPSTHIIRVTSDCPLHDPQILDHCIEQYLDSGMNYMSNSEAYPNGMNVEIFSAEMLAEANNQGLKPYEREHVTPYFYTHPELFRLGQVRSEQVYPKYRLTVDTPEDFQLIQTLIERLWPVKPNFDLADICHEFDKDPSLNQINSHIEQKKYNETQKK